MMNFESLFPSSGTATVVLISLLIFLSRVLDVSLGTMRIIFISRGLKYLAPLVGFFEILIWLLAIRSVLQSLTSIPYSLAYAAGFASGSYLGLYIEKKLAIGKSILRIITKKDATEMVAALRSKGYGVTVVDAEGAEGSVNVIYMIIKRLDFEPVTEIINTYHPRAFYTQEDIRYVSEGVFPKRKRHPGADSLLSPFRFWRKGK